MSKIVSYADIVGEQSCNYIKKNSNYSDQVSNTTEALISSCIITTLQFLLKTYQDNIRPHQLNTTSTRTHRIIKKETQ